MTQTVVERLIQTREGERLFRQEQVILDVTELICRVMHEDGVSRVQLAKRLGKSKGFVSQLLDGEHNMTIRTISDVFLALNRTVRFSCEEDAKQASEVGGDTFLTFFPLVSRPVTRWARSQWPTVVARPARVPQGLA